jgi:hypothetical protein
LTKKKHRMREKRINENEREMWGGRWVEENKTKKP